MANTGPVEYMVVAFPGDEFGAEIFQALINLVNRGIVRVIDLAFVKKDAHSNTTTIELEDISAGASSRELEASHQLESELGGILDLINEDDLHAIAEELQPSSSAVVLVWEDIWATELVAAMRDANGVLLDLERIPKDVVETALAHAGAA